MKARTMIYLEREELQALRAEARRARISLAELLRRLVREYLRERSPAPRPPASLYLKIKTFVGTSANALKVQVWTALIAMLLLKYLQLRSRFAWSLANLVALLRMNLFTHRDLWAWLDEPFEGPPTVLTTSQGVLALG